MELKNIYINQERTVLKDKIPFTLPLCLSIEPTNICNFKCTMCFHGNNEDAEAAKPICNMEMATFNKIIEDVKAWTLKKASKIKLIKLYSLGEPLVNKNLPEMVRIIKDADICDKIEITTNASLLTEEIAKKLVDYNLDILRISVYGATKEQNKKITQSVFTPDEIKKNVEFLKCYRDENAKKTPMIIAKMLNTYSEENDKFFELYQGVADEVGLDEPFNLPAVENNIFENMYGEDANKAHEMSMSTNQFSGSKACRYPFTHMTIRNDGSAIVCCADWLKELCYGNVNDNSVKELWESKKLYDIRCNMIKTKGKCFNACKTCEIPFRDSPEDNVDDVDINVLSYNE